MVDTVEDDVHHVRQQVPHDGQGCVRGNELLHYVENLGLAAGQNVHLEVDVECLGVGGHGVVSGDLLGHAGDEDPGPGGGDGGQGVPGGPAAVRHRSEGQSVLLTGHPESGLATHVQEAEEDLGDLQVRLPEDKPPTDEVYRCPAERSVGTGSVGRDQHQVHQGLGRQAGQVTGQGH